MSFSFPRNIVYLLYVKSASCLAMTISICVYDTKNYISNESVIGCDL